MTSMIVIAACLALGALVDQSTSSAILTEYDEIHDQYCLPDNVSIEIMAAVEDCFQIKTADFRGINPFTECKRNVFQNSETDAEMRKVLCADNDYENDAFEACMDMVIMTHDVFKELFLKRVDCMKRALR